MTAFLFSGLAARHFWATAILAPRFLTSAFAAGPAILLLLAFFVRRISTFDPGKQAIQKLAQIVTYAMAINLFFVAVEGSDLVGTAMAGFDGHRGSQIVERRSFFHGPFDLVPVCGHFPLRTAIDYGHRIGTEAAGDFYQISNQVTLGVSEEEIQVAQRFMREDLGLDPEAEQFAIRVDALALAPRQ